MTLREKQSEFGRCLTRLLFYIELCGYEYTFGDFYRPQDAGYGHPQSNHHKRLAADILLFWRGEYLKSSGSYKKFGEWWEKQHELARWGGRFGETEPGTGDGWDGNHFSFEHNGVK